MSTIKPATSGDELEARILAELEEFRVDEICPVLNKVLDCRGREQEVMDFARAVTSLIKKNKIELGSAAFFPRNEQFFDSLAALTCASNLSAEMMFDPESAFWKPKHRASPDDRSTIIALTEQGVQAAQALLTRRGYGWWKPIKPRS